ncbi:MAG: hypothetical protein J5641_03565 [Bacteroidales bacterium]|nr:hypothetical protein [Bacteroidales bacterium]MBR5061657.1 hypothetical protein [Prevotella sp.]
MRSKVGSVIVSVAVLLVPCLLFMLMERHNKHEEHESDKEFDQLLEKVYFEGDVLSSPKYKHSTLLCIRIDTASVDSFYYFSRDWALCIREGVAVMPIGMVDENDSSDLFKTHAQRVLVNKDYGRKTHFVVGSDTLTEDLSLWPGKLNEVHLLAAWEDTQDTIQ